MSMTKWVPESDPKILRRVGKTGEEAAELSKVCSRITVQGIDGVDPKTGVPNRQALMEELADVQAQIGCCVLAFDLDQEYMALRTARKMDQMAEWEAMFDPGS